METTTPGPCSMRKSIRQINPQPDKPEGTETVSNLTKSEMKREILQQKQEIQKIIRSYYKSLY